jgi:hypothetical protein
MFCVLGGMDWDVGCGRDGCLYKMGCVHGDAGMYDGNNCMCLLRGAVWL